MAGKPNPCAQSASQAEEVAGWFAKATDMAAAEIRSTSEHGIGTRALFNSAAVVCLDRVLA